MQSGSIKPEPSGFIANIFTASKSKFLKFDIRPERSHLSGSFIFQSAVSPSSDSQVRRRTNSLQIRVTVFDC